MTTPFPDNSGDAEQKPRRGILQIILGSKVIMISILIHVLFGLAATLYIVQTIQTKRKTVFQGGPPPGNPATREIEHKVSMAHKSAAMSAPAQARRITTTGLASITLPDMPSMPSATDIVPDKMAGMGGMGVGFGAGGSGGGGNGNGNGFNIFGMHQATGGALIGHFYDLKQTKDRRPTNIKVTDYSNIVQEYVREGWHESQLSKFYRASATLFTTQVFTPAIPAELGPKAFGVENEVKPSLWIVHYHGMVSPPESGVYYFVGAGDDVMIVHFGDRNVLDRCWEMQLENRKPVVEATANYTTMKWLNPYGFVPNGFARGLPMNLTAGQYYPVDILIGEQPGGASGFELLIMKDGVTYNKDGDGNPILPIFRVAKGGPLPPPMQGFGYANHDDNGPIWSAKVQTGKDDLSDDSGLDTPLQ
jgi:hypothetical protein